jgi:hypothetical protein
MDLNTWIANITLGTKFFSRYVNWKSEVTLCPHQLALCPRTLDSADEEFGEWVRAGGARAQRPIPSRSESSHSQPLGVQLDHSRTLHTLAAFLELACLPGYTFIQRAEIKKFVSLQLNAYLSSNYHLLSNN